MSHCAPEATLKPKRIEFMLETVITDVFVAQVYWEAVPKTWPGSCKASVTKCVVRPWNSTRSVGGRAELTSWTFRNQVYVVSQVRRCLAGQRRVNNVTETGQQYVWKEILIGSGGVKSQHFQTYVPPIGSHMWFSFGQHCTPYWILCTYLPSTYLLILSIIIRQAKTLHIHSDTIPSHFLDIRII